MKTIEVKWPSGTIDTMSDVAANQVVYVKEGSGLVKDNSSKK